MRLSSLKRLFQSFVDPLSVETFLSVPRLIRRIFGLNTGVAPAAALYKSVVEAARRPDFYFQHGVANTVDGRFDMIVLHLFLVISRFPKQERSHPVLEAMLEEFFVDMDRSLRELGAGDTGVKHRIHKMIDSIYGRFEAYERAIVSGRDALAQTLMRNVYRREDEVPQGLESLVSYVYEAQVFLSKLEADVVLSGEARFPEQSAGPS